MLAMLYQENEKKHILAKSKQTISIENIN